VYLLAQTAAGYQHQPGHPLGMVVAEMHRDRPAQRMAGRGDGAEAERVEEVADHFCE
jgi:hypothetical protein